MCFFCKRKTAYEMRISDWSSDVCSSDLRIARSSDRPSSCRTIAVIGPPEVNTSAVFERPSVAGSCCAAPSQRAQKAGQLSGYSASCPPPIQRFIASAKMSWNARSEEHTSELQSLMRISYAVFCLKKKKTDIKL